MTIVTVLHAAQLDNIMHFTYYEHGVDAVRNMTICKYYTMYTVYMSVHSLDYQDQ